MKALVAYPDVLARMAESPQWLADLGEAYSGSAAAGGSKEMARPRPTLRTSDRRPA